MRRGVPYNGWLTVTKPPASVSGTRTPRDRSGAPVSVPAKKIYKATLRKLQVELVKLQRHFIRCDDKILIILEGRDASGKDGVIKRIVEHLSPRDTRVVALGKPSDRERDSWYFQRFVPHLPAAQELVLFNRSWYNRAGVERVMGFCTEAEYEEFMGSVSDFEQMLVGSGVKLLKYYLDISKDEQRRRLRKRRTDPLKQWKISPIDNQAMKRWKAYSRARNEMLARTHSSLAPWTVVRANDKRQARLNIIKDLLGRLHYAGKSKGLIQPDSKVVFAYHASTLKNDRLANQPRLATEPDDRRYGKGGAMKTSVMEVRDMLSVLSVDGVEKRIGDVPGVESVTVNFAAGNATVRYDETRLDIADIKSGVRQSGFESAAADAASGKQGHDAHTVPSAPAKPHDSAAPGNAPEKTSDKAPSAVSAPAPKPTPAASAGAPAPALPVSTAAKGKAEPDKDEHKH